MVAHALKTAMVEVISVHVWLDGLANHVELVSQIKNLRKVCGNAELQYTD